MDVRNAFKVAGFLITSRDSIPGLLMLLVPMAPVFMGSFSVTWLLLTSPFILAAAKWFKEEVQSAITFRDLKLEREPDPPRNVRATYRYGKDGRLLPSDP